MNTKLPPFPLLALAFALAIWIDPYGHEMLQYLGDFFARAHIGEFTWWCFEQIASLVFQGLVWGFYFRFLKPWLHW